MVDRHRREWEELSRLDPLWAIASTPGLQHGRWDDEAFMASGRRKAARVLARLERLGAPAERRRALDFGCGVGRLTIPFAERFGEVVGVDVAPGMLEQAARRAQAAGRRNIRLVLGDDGLAALDGERFDLVYSSQVLQHLPSRPEIARSARSLARLVAPGGVLVAQVPDRIGLRDRLGPGRRAYAALRALGVPPAILYERLRVNPIRMVSYPRAAFESLLADAGLQVVSVVERRSGALCSYTYQAVRPPTARPTRRERPSGGREERAA